LNFLARTVPDARCGGCPLTETNTFTIRVYPRNEFVHPLDLDSSNELLLPRRRLSDRVSRHLRLGASPEAKWRIARLKHLLLTGASGCETGGYSKLIKEDHWRGFNTSPYFACTTKMSEFFWVRSATCVSKRLNEPGSRLDNLKYTRDSQAHILAVFRLFTCQRAQIFKQQSLT